MADNVTRTTDNKVIATDEIGAVHYQRNKMVVGADGTANDVRDAQSDSLNAGVVPAGLYLQQPGATWSRAAGAAYSADGYDGARAVQSASWLFNGTTWDRQKTVQGSTDGTSGTGLSAQGGYLYNGSTFDRQRGNTEGTLLASAARTGTTGTANQTNYNARGVILYLNVTAASGTGGVRIRVSFRVPGDTGYTFADGQDTTAVGLYTMVVYPGATFTETASSGLLNDYLSVPLPRTWSASVRHADASSYTYSLTHALIV